MTTRRRLARGSLATRLGLLAASVLVACVDQRASLGRFAEAGPKAAGAAGTGVGGSAGRPEAPDAASPPAAPDAGPAPEAPPALDAGAVQPPAPVPPVAACAARTYLGNFVCALRTDGPFAPPPGSPPLEPMMAALPFRLEPSADGTVAEIVDGSFMFVAWGLGFTGRFEGQLDCASGRFDALIVDGMTGQLFMGGPTTFVGALEGRVVDPARGTLEGTWWHGPMAGAGCIGTWSALPQGP